MGSLAAPPEGNQAQLSANLIGMTNNGPRETAEQVRFLPLAPMFSLHNKGDIK